MTTASLTSTPTTLDAGTSASISIVNTGTTRVTITNGVETTFLRAGREYNEAVNGAVTAAVPTELGGSGTIRYAVGGARADVVTYDELTALVGVRSLLPDLAASTVTTGTLVVGQLARLNCTSANLARTLPSAAAAGAGSVVGVRRADTNSAFAATISPAGSDTINGSATARATSLPEVATSFVSDGVSNWSVYSTDTPSSQLTATYVPAVVVPYPTGVAATDAANFAAAMARVPTTGGTVQLQSSPFGSAVTYDFTSGVTIDKPTWLRGAGCGTANRTTNVVTAPTKIVSTSATGTAITATVDGCKFSDFALVNTAGGSGATAGAGIQVTAGKDDRLRDLIVSGFWDNIRMENAYEWVYEGITSLAPRRYGLFIANPSLPDGGDMTVTGSQFIAFGSQTTPAAAIRWESGGGLRVGDNKINYRGGNQFARGVDLELTPGATTSVILINGNSMENITETGVRVTTADGTSSLSYMHIGGNEIMMSGNAVTAAISVSATNDTQIFQAVIAPNVLRSLTAQSAPAVSLTNVKNFSVERQVNSGFNSGNLVTSGCTNIRNANRTPYLYRFNGGGDVTTTSTSFVDLITVRPIGANISDVIKVTLTGMVYCTSTTPTKAIFTFAKSDGTELGKEYEIRTTATSNSPQAVHYVLYYVVAAADISAGVVSIKPQIKCDLGTTTIVWLNSAGFAGTYTLENLGCDYTIV